MTNILKLNVINVTFRIIQGTSPYSIYVFFKENHADL